MTHIELSNLITDYVEGALDGSAAERVEAHLAECIPCRTMVEDVRLAMAACHRLPEMEPAPWLVTRILRATTGERKPGFSERLAAWWRPIFRPQLAYSLSMVVFSLSFVLYAANVHLRSMALRDVNPLVWVERANSRGHMLVARAEKYYYDLRVVYEVQSLLRGLEQQPAATPAKHPNPGRPAPSAGDESSVYGTDLAAEMPPAMAQALASSPTGGDQTL